MATFHTLHQRTEAADLTTIQAARVASSLVAAGVEFQFLPVHLTGGRGHSITTPAKHAKTLETAVEHSTRVPTVGKGDQP